MAKTPDSRRSAQRRSDDRLFLRSLGPRELEALRLIEERPGITVAELQAALGVGNSRLGKILSALGGRLRREPALLPESPELQPLVSQRLIPPEVERAREVARAHDAHFEAIVAPLVEGHLATYTMAVDAIEEAHQHIADSTDLDLTGDTRWAAMWQMGGRSIGYCRVLLALSWLGFGDEALPTARAVHEADRLLGVFGEADEGQIVLRWLADDDATYVRPRDARQATARIEERIAKKMEAAGQQRVRSTDALTRDLYHRMSVVSHNRRESTQAAVWPQQRRMARGRHPSPIARAGAVLTLGTMIESGVMHVGEALIWAYGMDWLRSEVRPLRASFEAIREQMPLDAESLLRLGERPTP